MPLSVPKRLFESDALPSSQIEIDSDILSPIGIKRGSTIEYFTFEERFMERFFHVKIKKTGEHIVTRICFDCHPVRIHYDSKLKLSDVKIIGLIVEKPKLRLVK